MYIIDGIDFKTKLTDVIEGTDITYLQYYEEKYGIKIKNKTQPLLIHEQRRKTPTGEI